MWAKELIGVLQKVHLHEIPHSIKITEVSHTAFSESASKVRAMYKPDLSICFYLF